MARRGNEGRGEVRARGRKREKKKGRERCVFREGCVRGLLAGVVAEERKEKCVG